MAAEPELSRAPPAYFESFGSVSVVLRDLEAHVPAIFQDEAQEILKSLNQNIPLTAAQNKWDSIVVILSRGFARTVLNDLADAPFPHKGAIFVDPVAKTPEHMLLETDGAFKSTRERLIMVNETMNEVMVVMYGLEDIDRSNDFHLLLRHLRMTNMTLDLLMEEDSETTQEQAGKVEPTERARLLRSIAEQLLWIQTAVLAEPEHTDARYSKDFQPVMKRMYETIIGLAFSPDNPSLSFQFRQLTRMIRQIPPFLKRLGYELGFKEDLDNTHDAPKTPQPYKPVVQRLPEPEPDME